MTEEAYLSWSPCSNCRSTSNGRLSFFYLATFEGERRLSYRLRLCQKCAVTLVSDLVSVADQQIDGQWRTPEEI
jgi:hypothetical protein